METNISIDNPLFAETRKDFDRYLTGTIRRAIEISASECSVSLKLSIDLAGCDDMGRMMPVFKYKINCAIPISGGSKNRVQDDCVIEPTEEGLQLRTLTEQQRFI